MGVESYLVADTQAELYLIADTLAELHLLADMVAAAVAVPHFDIGPHRDRCQDTSLAHQEAEYWT